MAQTLVPQQAAILLHTANKDATTIKMQEDVCRSYCQKRGYQLFEEDIYRDEGWPLYRDASQLVDLRLLAVQGELDVLVIEWPGDLGILPPWKDRLVVRTIVAFYQYG